ncbi:hypothetical protein DICVIV_12904 [Dictyocaulus viviparus]|uniref:ZP domain-containing protein n=1 Tax=Dictyocaulus viviparus TaxID=29172 RepID=A0A0D8XBI3_DICVI|nr:hypothetical protein DICVIV_12904 [Dictyocaulus viviparus]
MVLLILFFFVLAKDVVTLSHSNTKEIEINRFTKSYAKCEFSVHKDGPDGVLVTGAALDMELYYSIKCEPYDDHCLFVSNCTISSDEAGLKPYPVIDEYGCSLEPSLYEHVTYVSNFIAGIRNPYPVRFRSSSGAVVLYCVTTLLPTTAEGTCNRHECMSTPSP